MSKSAISANAPILSIVTPMFNEEAVLDAYFARLIPVLEEITAEFEIVCIDDGSRDRTWSLLKQAHDRDHRIKVIALSRNFGKEAALTAGLHAARGSGVIPVDADLQDPPELIPELVEKWREGFDVVLAVRSDRSSDTLFKRASASMFYRLVAHLDGVEITRNAGDFRLMDRSVVEALKRLPERTRMMKGLFGWLGFSHAVVEYVRPARVGGDSKWRFWQLWNFALDGILSFWTFPIRIWTYIGAVTAIGAIGYAGIIVFRTLAYGTDVPGYASIFVAILFFSGLLMINLGIIGEYLGRVFLEVKRRPLYLVSEQIGFGSDDIRPTDRRTIEERLAKPIERERVS